MTLPMHLQKIIILESFMQRSYNLSLSVIGRDIYYTIAHMCKATSSSSSPDRYITNHLDIEMGHHIIIP